MDSVLELLVSTGNVASAGFLPAKPEVRAEGLYRSVIPNDEEWLVGIIQVTTPRSPMC